jgi:hypothetical protein
MDKLYKLRGKITNMDDHGVLEAMLRTERESRTGEFSYPPSLVYQSQIDGIKADWPDDLKQLVKAKAAEFSAGQPVTAGAVRRAVEDVIMGVVVPRRANARTAASPEAKARAIETEAKIASADLAISALMGVAPCVATAVSPRKTKMGMAVTRTSWERVPGLIVKTTEVKDADVFFLCHYIPAIRRSWLVGWSTRGEVALSECGSSVTDSSRFPWKIMSHFMDAHKLRPMSAALKALGLKDVPDGVLLESTPKMDDVPWATAGDVESFLTTNEQSGKDFYAILGMDAPDPKAAQASAPEPQKQDDF